MKRIKYSNGGQGKITKRVFKNVGDLELSGSGTLNALGLTASADATATYRKNGTVFTASTFRDTNRTTGDAFSIEQQLPNSSITFNKNKQGKNVTFRKNGLSVFLDKPKGQSTAYGLTYQRTF